MRSVHTNGDDDRAEKRIAFVEADRVEALFADREAFREFWDNELSKAGLFVATQHPPSLGSIIQLHVATPDGAIDLKASVVHVIPQQTARALKLSPGVGLQVDAFHSTLREHLERYANGDQACLSLAPTEDREPTSAELNAILDRARRLITDYNSGDFYDALEIEPNVDESSLAQRVEQLENEFARAGTLKPPQRARIDTALAVLAKMSTVLGVTDLRLQYDLRTGRARVEVRLAAAKSRTGPSVVELRKAWSAVHPEEVERAGVLMRQALAAAHQGDFLDAVRHGAAALDLDPFFEQLRSHMAQWKALSSQ